jgi:hypothetical protein
MTWQGYSARRAVEGLYFLETAPSRTLFGDSRKPREQRADWVREDTAVHSTCSYSLGSYSYKNKSALAGYHRPIISNLVHQNKKPGENGLARCPGNPVLHNMGSRQQEPLDRRVQDARAYTEPVYPPTELPTLSEPRLKRHN